ncbi:MAG: phenylacetate--CoA ligase [Bacillota bacterium]|nr:phenylacetate--CoA ligase [Bacillota bacterium]
MIWNKERETMPRKALRELQLEGLKWTVNRVWDHVPYYRAKMEAIGLKPKHIVSLDDLSKLPFMTKQDFRDNYPFNNFAVPKEQLIRIHASSGTTGKPTVVGYTRHDLDMWTELMARIVTQAGVTSDDIAQNCFTYGLFTGSFGLHYGMERIGAAIVPVSGGNTDKQLMLMEDFGTTALIATPFYALYLAERAAELGIDITKRLKLRVGLFGSEPWTEEMRTQIEQTLHLTATDNYGMSELIGPGVSGECECFCGMHIAEDHFLPETIDTETGEVLNVGEQGELVFTSLDKEALPVIRYRTKDISVLDDTPCACGRTHTRMRKISGRTDDMLIIRGINVFPSQIESALLGISGVGPYYQINIYRKNYLDELEVLVEFTDETLLDNFKKLDELTQTARERLYNVLGINVKLRLVEPHTLERTTQGKSKKVFDKRNDPQ